MFQHHCEIVYLNHLGYNRVLHSLYGVYTAPPQSLGTVYAARARTFDIVSGVLV